LFVSPYNLLLFLPKKNKENGNSIDFSLSKEQNLRKYFGLERNGAMSGGQAFKTKLYFTKKTCVTSCL
jgi:hypothetical protein